MVYTYVVGAKSMCHTFPAHTITYRYAEDCPFDHKSVWDRPSTAAEVIRPSRLSTTHALFMPVEVEVRGMFCITECESLYVFVMMPVLRLWLMAICHSGTCIMQLYLSVVYRSGELS